MEWRLRLSVLVVASCIAAAAPGVALAVGPSVLLDYGATYTAGGTQRTHRGVDVAMAAGAPAESLVTGEVSFCGRIPADEGGSVLAVTVRMCDGALVTIHPLSESWVSVGEAVSPGDGLGLVAGSGDASVAESHVHVSLRRGDAYLDPSSLLITAEPVPPTPVVPPQMSSTPVADAPPAGATPHAAVSAPAPVELAAKPATTLGQLAGDTAVVSGSPLKQVPPLPAQPTETSDGAVHTPVYQRYRSSSGIALPGGATAARGLLAAAGISGIALVGAAVKRRAFVLAEVER